MTIHNLGRALFCNIIGVFSVLLFASSACASGTPLTLKDAYRDCFLVGVAVNRTIADGSGGTADNVNRTTEQVQKDVEIVTKHFNQIVAENDMKWALIHPRAGADGYDFKSADAFVSFGQRNGMYLVGHTLVWHGQTPDWVFQGNIPPPPRIEGHGPAGNRRYRYDGPRASREELLARMREHIHAVVGRYKGKIKVWDVVNEAISDSGEQILRETLWLEIIGPDFIAKAFEYAHEADPEAILRYNDYGLENPTKRHKLIVLISSLLGQHVPVMAIGSQTHVTVSKPTVEQMEETLNDLACLGLPIHITELDVNAAKVGQATVGADISANSEATKGGLVEDAEKRQSDQYANLFRAFANHKDFVKMVTLWGVNDAVSWRRNGNPLLFDGNDTPKPAFNAVIQAASDQRKK